MMPLLAWLALFVIAPTIVLLIYSFCKPNTLIGGVVFEFSASAYQRVFELDGPTMKIFLRSLYYAAVTTVICVIMGYPVAYFIGRAPEAWRNRLLLMVMIPFWTSFLIRTYAWMTLLKREGLLNSFLELTRVIPNVIREPLDLMYTPTAVVIGLVYTYLPFMILPIYGSVEKLDNALIEAAFDLGAGPIRAFSRVIVPLTRPGIFAGVLLVFIPAIGMFAVTDLMGGRKIILIGNRIQNQIGPGRNWPYAAAMGITLLALFVITYWVFTRRRREG
jgi:spermidine/putrescine transport system permease protein